MKKLLYMALLGIVNISIFMIPWIPSFPFRVFLAILFVFILIKNFYLSKDFFYALYTGLLTKICKFCTVVIVFIGISIRIGIFIFISLNLYLQFLFLSKHQETYVFQNQSFYLYNLGIESTEFKGYHASIKRKIDYLPIYIEISKVKQYSNKIILKEHKGIVSYVCCGMETNIYDLNQQKNTNSAERVINREVFTKVDILQYIKTYKSLAKNSLALRNLIKEDEELKLVKSKKAMKKFEEILKLNNYTEKKDFYKVEQNIHYIERDFYVKQLKDKNVSSQICTDIASINKTKNQEIFDICKALVRTQTHLKQVTFTDVKLGNYNESNMSIEPFLSKLIEARSNPLLIKKFRFHEVVPFFEGSSLYISQELCREGNSTECFNVAKKYEEGKELRIDIEKAKKFYFYGCYYNDVQACFNAGKLYDDRDTDDGDLKLAAYFYETSCDSNHAKGCLMRGTLYQAYQKEEKALELFYKSCTLKEKEGCRKHKVLQKELYEEEKIELENKFDCDYISENTNKCRYIYSFYKGKFPKNLKSKLNKNIVIVGYSDTSYRYKKKQLITLKLTETNSCYSEKKKDTYYLCMSPVFGETSDERYDVELAIESLEKNKIPSKNNAYLYGKSFKFKEKHCSYINLEKDNFFLSSYDNEIRLTQNEDQYILLNKKWGNYKVKRLLLEF